jgi:hypothetical protein
VAAQQLKKFYQIGFLNSDMAMRVGSVEAMSDFDDQPQWYWAADSGRAGFDAFERADDRL